jgi:WD40 repeat protein
MIRVYDIATKHVIFECSSPEFQIRENRCPAICFSPAGTGIAISMSNVLGREKFRVLIFHKFALKYHKFALCTDYNDTGIQKVYNDKGIQKIEGYGEVTAMCFLLDGKRLAVGCKKKKVDGSGRQSESDFKTFVVITEISSGNELHKIDHDDYQEVSSLCLSPDGLCIATSQASVARIVDLKHHASMMTLKKTVEANEDVSLFCFSPADGTIIATCGRNNFARIINLSTGNIVLQVDHGEPVKSVCFSSDAQMIATCSNDCACIFDIATGFLILRTPLNGIRVAAVLFDRNGDRIVSGNWDIFKHVVSGTVDDTTDDQIMLSEFFFADGAGFVALAARWRQDKARLRLKKLFEKEYPVINAGLILRNLLITSQPKPSNPTTRPGSRIVPDSALIEALLRNVSKYTQFAVRDSLLTQQLACAAREPCLRSVVGSFWTEMVQFIPSHPITVIDVSSRVMFSETTRMYVVASNSTLEPVFESFFNKFPQVEGPQSEFEHLLVPFRYLSKKDGRTHGGSFQDLVYQLWLSATKKYEEDLKKRETCPKKKRETCPDCFNLYRHNNDNAPTLEQDVDKSLLEALVDSDNLDIFGSPIVRSIVQFKWCAF